MTEVTKEMIDAGNSIEWVVKFNPYTTKNCFLSSESLSAIYLSMREKDPEFVRLRKERDDAVYLVNHHSLDFSETCADLAEALEIMKSEVAFLLARLKDFEPGDGCEREYHGHVLPAIERLEVAYHAFVEKHSKGEANAHKR